MNSVAPCVLKFSPTDQYVAARIVPLTSGMIREKMGETWWKHPALIDALDPPPIDRFWRWGDVQIDWEGQILESDKVAVVTGDGAVQGAMLFATQPVTSLLTQGDAALFIELLFTAPHNRPSLRKDRRKHFSGVGPELLRWATARAWRSGLAGRLRLDASPDTVSWYASLGFEILPVSSVEFEGVHYTPMELSTHASRTLFSPHTPPRLPHATAA